MDDGTGGRWVWVVGGGSDSDSGSGSGGCFVFSAPHPPQPPGTKEEKATEKTTENKKQHREHRNRVCLYRWQLVHCGVSASFSLVFLIFSVRFG